MNFLNWKWGSCVLPPLLDPLNVMMCEKCSVFLRNDKVFWKFEELWITHHIIKLADINLVFTKQTNWLSVNLWANYLKVYWDREYLLSRRMLLYHFPKLFVSHCIQIFLKHCLCHVIFWYSNVFIILLCAGGTWSPRPIQPHIFMKPCLSHPNFRNVCQLAGLEVTLCNPKRKGYPVS